VGSLSQFKEDGDTMLRGHLSAGKGVGGVGLLKAGENADYSLHNLIVRCSSILASVREEQFMLILAYHPRAYPIENLRGVPGTCSPT